MPENLTMKDIALMLGLSVSTVSRALNNSPAISKEVRERVQRCAAEHHFTINRMAARLRQSRVEWTNVMGVIVPEMTHYYFACVLSGVMEACMQRGYSVMVGCSNERHALEKRLCQQFDANRVSGVIVSQAMDTPLYDYDHFRILRDRGVPLVFYDRISTGIEADRVVVDDYHGAFNAVEHMIATGCRRIAFCDMEAKLEIQKNRFNGYRDALLKHGLPVDPDLHLMAESRDKAYSITPGVMNRADPPDAFFAVNDEAAIGVLYAVKRMGLRVPDDVSICGFSNAPESHSCDPKLTTVEQRGHEVGRQAAAIVFDKVEGVTPRDKVERRVVKTRLVVRETTRG